MYVTIPTASNSYTDYKLMPVDLEQVSTQCHQRRRGDSSSLLFEAAAELREGLEYNRAGVSGSCSSYKTHGMLPSRMEI